MPDQLPPEVQKADAEMKGATEQAIASTAPQVVLPADALAQFGEALNEAKESLGGGQIPRTEYQIEGDGPMPPAMFAEAVAMGAALKGVKAAKKFAFDAKQAATSPGALSEQTSRLQAIATSEDVLDEVRPASGSPAPAPAPPESPKAPEGGKKVDKYEGLL